MCDSCIEWNGIRWHRYGNGYYEYRGTRSKDRKDRDRLHRAVYKNHFGEIPDGLDVHHIDGDKANNDISNLELLSRSDHLRHHALENPIPKVDFSKLVFETFCQDCGCKVTRKVKTKICLCKQCQYKRSHKKSKKITSCSHCGEEFLTAKGNYCSQRCVNLATKGGNVTTKHCKCKNE